VGRAKIIVVVIAATLATSAASPGVAYAHEPVLELYRRGSASECPLGCEYLEPGTEMELFSAGINPTFTGAMGSLGWCDGSFWLTGSVLSNGKRRDKISLHLRFGSERYECVHEKEEVVLSTASLTLTLSARLTVSLQGQATFTFTNGCAYTTQRLTGEVYSGEELTQMSLSGLTRRTDSDPRTCEKYFIVGGLGGALESRLSSVVLVVPSQ
jgi:hypothetical protein